MSKFHNFTKFECFVTARCVTPYKYNYILPLLCIPQRSNAAACEFRKNVIISTENGVCLFCLWFSQCSESVHIITINVVVVVTCFTVQFDVSGALQWGDGQGNLRYLPREDVQSYLEREIDKRLKQNQKAQLKKLVDTADAGQRLLHTYAEACNLDMCRLLVEQVATIYYIYMYTCCRRHA